LLTRAQAVLEQMREIGEAVASAATELRGRDDGAHDGRRPRRCAGLLGRYHERHPAVAVQLRATGLGSSGLVAQLERGEIDLALLAVVDALPASLRGEVVAASPYVLVVPARIPSRMPRGDPRDARGESFVDLPPGTGRGASSTTPSPMPGCRAVCSSRSPIFPRPPRMCRRAWVGDRAAFRGAGGLVGLGRPFADPAPRMPVRIVSLDDAVPAFEVSLAWSRRRPLTAAAQASSTCCAPNCCRSPSTTGGERDGTGLDDRPTP
jgi:DNA-binding transcriptional LysR family regulator